MVRLSRPVAAAAMLVAVLGALTACGRRSGGGLGSGTNAAAVGAKGSGHEAAGNLGFPLLATKNTTRVDGADPTANAAGVARAVFPAASVDSRPQAVVLVDSGDWRAGIAASVLAGAPVHGAILLSNGPSLRPASSDALQALQPTGAQSVGGAQIIRVGDVARPPGMRTTDIRGKDPFALARAIDAFQAAAANAPAKEVLIASADDPAFAMPAAAWAAKSADPVLFVHQDSVPPDTVQALRTQDHPRIYILGPPTAVGFGVESSLRSLGTVTRIGAPAPVENAVAFARYTDGKFGWGVVDPGHGLVFARGDQPMDAAAAAALSAHGTYGPLLLVSSPDRLDAALRSYLLDIQPGYASNPVRGVYNHGWLVGDDRALSVGLQTEIDDLLEITQVTPAKTQ